MQRSSCKSRPARYTRYKIARATIQGRYRGQLGSLLKQTAASPLSNGNARWCVTCFTCVDDRAVIAGTTVVRCAEWCATRMVELTMTVSSKFRLRSSIAAGALMLSIAVSPPIAGAAPPATDPTVMITDLGTQGIQSLGQAASSAERIARLGKLFQQDFDINGIGTF